MDQTIVLNRRTYRIGDVVEATVYKVMPIGALVRLKDGNRGVIRRRELSWEQSISDQDLLQIVSEGQSVNLVVLGMDRQSQRLALSLRQIKYAPWERLQKQDRVIGSVVRGVVVDLKHYGAFVELLEPKGVEGLLHISQIPGYKGQGIDDLLWIGDHIEAVIIDYDAKKRKLGLSISQRFETARGKRRDTIPVEADTESGIPNEDQEDNVLECSIRRTGVIQNVLLVDDEKEFVRSFNSLLKRLGYTVHVSTTGKDGIEKAVAAEYDLIFLDLHLRDIDGFEVARQILANRPTTRIVIVTGLDWLERDVDTNDLTIAGVLLKPLDSREVIDLLRAFEAGKHTTTAVWTDSDIDQSGFFDHVVSSLQSGDPLSARVERILEELCEATEADAAFVFRMDSISRTVSVLASYGYLPQHEDGVHDLKFSPVRDVAMDKESVFENNVGEGAQARFAYLLKFVLFESCIALPLSASAGDACYALFLLHSSPGSFTELHRQQAALFAWAIEVDIERSRLELIIRQQQRLILIGQLGLSLVHEVNNKLTGIEQHARNLQLDHADIAREPTKCQDPALLRQVKNRIGCILDVSAELRKLSHTYLGLAKTEEFDDVDIARIALRVRDMVAPLARKQGIDMQMDLGLAVPIIKSVPLRLEQILLNLALNAVQQMRPGAIEGKPLRLQIASSYQPGVSALPIKIRVMDTGPGIHRQQFEWIFKMGTSTRENGSGLGLFISNGLIESLGGKLSVEESVMFAGTTFLVELPEIPTEEVAQ
jgi:signal transduction histidine kinase/predicted RNA-binding protein with RPS1 domain/ActR/RegA family two-component response regulator